MLASLPPQVSETRDALRALACYAIAPAQKLRIGRIGLRAVEEGFGTRLFDDGTRISVHGDALTWGRRRTPITTVRAAAAFVGIAPSSDPGVGHDLPPYAPDAPLVVDREASLALGRWYAFGDELLQQLRARTQVVSMTEAQLWPEHFDLAVTVELPSAARVNVGVSPGDPFHDEPYVYVGPHDLSGLDGAFWNAPFGAVLTRRALAASVDPAHEALRFVRDGFAELTPAAPA
jgi:hypothetical protein